MKRLLLLTSILLMSNVIFLFADEKAVAPVQLPNTNSQMFSPGFWISRHATPDKVIMTPEEIAAFNLNVRDNLRLTNNVFATIDDQRTQSLLGQLEARFTEFTDKGLFNAQGTRNDPEFLEKNKQKMHLTAIVAGISPRFGIITRLADQRFFPTDDGLYEKPGDFDFDQLQNSALDVGSPVAIVHNSRDGQWLYVYGPISDGWIKAADIAMGEKSQINEFVTSKNFVVVTAAYADVFTDEGMTHLAVMARMGTRLPLVGINDGKAVVLLPSRDPQGKLSVVNGFMDASSVHEGYLPMTARNIYVQLFRWLHTPYGWGDVHGFIDCSRLVQSVYETMGVHLPRDSKEQANAGKVFAELGDDKTLVDKINALVIAPAGSLLALKGHIMVYLGSVEGKAYVIQATSGYRQHEGDHEVVRSLMRVVVSDLTLGEGSSKGSLLKRMYRIVTIEKPDTH